MKSSGRTLICSSVSQSHSKLLQSEAADMFMLPLAAVVSSC